MHGNERAGSNGAELRLDLGRIRYSLGRGGRVVRADRVPRHAQSVEVLGQNPGAHIRGNARVKEILFGHAESL